MKYYYHGEEHPTLKIFGSKKDRVDLRIVSRMDWLRLKKLSDMYRWPITSENSRGKYHRIYLFLKKTRFSLKLAASIIFMENLLPGQDIDVFIRHKKYPDYRRRHGRTAGKGRRVIV